MPEVNVAIAGATGAVGAEFLKLLERRDYPIKSLKLLASKRSVGKTLKFKGVDIAVEELTHDSFESIDHAFFSAGGGRSKEFAESVAQAGAIMIDNSSAFRYENDIPLVIPEVNPEDAFNFGERRIIANPNCTTIVTLMAVAPLHREFGLKRIISSSYQAISGAGAAALEELEQQTRDWVAGDELKVEVSPKQIAFNAIPRVDALQDNGYTKEEMKLLWEGQKILHHDSLLASATCVRIPVIRSHSVSVNLEFEKDITPEAAREVLSKAAGVVVQDDPANDVYPTPWEQSDKDDVAVGRIRSDISAETGKGLSMWIVGDQLGKGAALNAIQIGELLLSKC
ncbi:MAG: aspartate-semialdehyde dehydrogenase [Planctomycetes bacterium]|nr:aspartate-semialdehyde dehydrogenase [Planctomycetota bacterium]